MNKILLLAFLTACFAACKKKDQSVDLYYNLYPLNPGHSIVYRVMEVEIDAELEQNDTSRYFLKTEIGDTVTDNEGRIARKFNRYKSASQSGPWTLTDVWTTIIENGKAELVEENQRVIKLVFPPTETQTWNMNAYNMLGTMDCYYSDLFVPRSVNGIYFDSTVTVEVQSFDSFIDFRHKYEVYARGIGLVNKYYKDYTIQNFDTTDIQKGTEIHMSVVGYYP